MSEMYARPCSTGCSPSDTAEPSSCVSTTPTARAASPSTRPPSGVTFSGSVSTGRARSSSRTRSPTPTPPGPANPSAPGRLYACYETPEELEFKRKRLLAQGRPPVYGRAALKLSDADRARLEGEGRGPHWRFKLTAEEVHWDDLVRGPQHIDEASQSDPVLVRADGSYLYSFTSVVDDIAFAITHALCGEDHRANTEAQS